MSFANSNMLGNEIHRSHSNAVTQRSQVPLPWHENKALNLPIIQTPVYQHTVTQQATPSLQAETYGTNFVAEREYKPMSMIVNVNSVGTKEEPVMSLTQISEMIASQNYNSQAPKRRVDTMNAYHASSMNSAASDASDAHDSEEEDDNHERSHPDPNSCQWEKPAYLVDSLLKLESKVHENTKILESHSMALQNHKTKIGQIDSNEKDVRIILQNHNKHISSNKTLLASHESSLRDCHGVMKKMKNDLMDAKNKSDLSCDAHNIAGMKQEMKSEINRNITGINERMKQHEESLADCKHTMHRMSNDLKSSIEGISDIKSKFKSRTSLDVTSGAPSRYMDMQMLEQEITKRRQNAGSKVK